MIFLALLLLLATVAMVRCSELIQAWQDPVVKEPKDFHATRFGLGCATQIVFKRGGMTSNDQSYSYHVIGTTKKNEDIELAQNTLKNPSPISAVNASAGYSRGAYRLQGEDSDYSLLPIQFWGCKDAVMTDKYKIKAVKNGSPAWFSPAFEIVTAPPPDQVAKLRAVRNAKNPFFIHVSWDASVDQWTNITGAFVVAGKSAFNDRLYSDFIRSKFVAKDTSTSFEIGPVPVNVTVVRYDNYGNGALSDVENCPQVQV